MEDKFLLRISFLFTSLFLTSHLDVLGQSDNCAGAPTISVNAQGTCNGVASTNAGSTTASDPVPACWASAPSNTVWYKFVAPATGSIHLSTNFTGNVIDPQVAIYSGACGALTLVSCQEDLAPGNTNNDMLINGLTPGSTYYIMIDGKNAATGAFSICLESQPTPSPPAPENDCPTATYKCDQSAVAVADGVFSVGSIQEKPGCFGNPGERASHWYTFTAQNNGVLQFTISPNSGANTDYDFAVFDVTNGCLGTQLSCNWSGNTAGGGVTGLGCANAARCNPAINLVAGKAYAILVDRYTASNSKGFTLDFSGTTSSFGPPIPSFTTSGCNGNTVDLNNTTPIGNNISFYWDFGDGTSSTLYNPGSHTYSTPGTYTITLFARVVQNGVVVCQQTKTLSVTVPNVGLSVVISPQNSSVCNGDPITLTANATPCPAGTYTVTGSNNTVMSIPDGGEPGGWNGTHNAGPAQIATSPITLNCINPNNYAIKVCLNIAHPYNSDLSVNLECPAGTVKNLAGTPTGSNFTGTCFEDGGANFFGSNGPYNGTYAPDAWAVGCGQNTTNFNCIENSCDPNGIWYLNVGDSFGADAGTLNNWNITVTTTNGIKSYLWSNGATTQAITVTPSVSTTYTLTVTDYKCNTATSQVAVSVNPKPSVTINSIQHVTCPGGNDGVITSNTATGGTAPFAYGWNTSPGQTGLTANGLSAGVYIVDVSDANGCSASASATVTEPAPLTVNAGPDVSACASNPVSLNGVISAGSTCTWTLVSGTGTFSAINNPVTNFTASSSGTITARLTVSIGTCTATYDDVVIKSGGPVISGLSNKTFCKGGSATLSVVANPSNTGTYTTASIAGPSTANVSNAGVAAGWNGTTNTYTESLINVPVSTCVDPASWDVGTVCMNLNHPNAAQVVAYLVAPSGQLLRLVQTEGGANNFGQVCFSQGAAASIVGQVAPFAGATFRTEGAGGSTVADLNSFTGSPIGTWRLRLGDTGGGAATTGPLNSWNISFSSTNSITSYAWSPSAGLSATNTASVTASPSVTTTYCVTVTEAQNCCSTSQCVVVTVNPTPTLTTSFTHVSCNGASNGTATATASGGTTNYNYTWTGGSVTSCANTSTACTTSNLGPGPYTVSVTDANSCGTSATVTITEPPVLNVNLTPAATPTICPNQTATFTIAASGGPTTPYTFAINTVSGLTATTNTASPNYTITVTPNATFSGTANYIVTVTSGACNTTRSVAVTVNPVPTFSITNSATYICSGAQTNITLTGPVGTNYGWTASAPGAAASGTSFTQQTLNNTGTGTIAVTYTITPTLGCVGTPSTTVVIIQPSPTLTTSFTGSTCNSLNDGTATATASGGSPNYTYTWSGGTYSCASQPGACTTNGLGVAAYAVTVSDARNCTRTATVTITQPTALATTLTPAATPTICPNQTATFSVGTSGGPTTPYTFAINTVSGLTATSNTASPNYNITVTPNATFSGTATYVVTVTSGACTTTRSVLVTVNPAPTFTITNAATYICSGAQTNITLTGPVGVNYGWTATAPGTNASGTSFTQQTLNNTGTGTIAVTYTITPTLGCVGTPSTTVVIIQPSPTLTTSFTGAGCNGANDGTATATASGGSPNYTYTWSGGTYSCAGQPGACTATGLSAIAYTVTVSDAQSCTRTGSVTITQPTALGTTLTPAATPTICPNQTATFTVGATGGPTTPYTFAINTVSGLTTTTNTASPNYNITVTPNATFSGTATYVVTVTSGSCTSTQNVLLTVTPGPSFTITNSPSYICSGTQTNITLNPAAGVNYSWVASGGAGSVNGGPATSFSQQTLTIATGTTAVTYTITPSVGACIGTPSSTIVVVQASPTLTTSFTPSGCSGAATGSVTATAGGGSPNYTYLWSAGTYTCSGIPGACTSTGLAANPYTVTVSDAAGCTATGNATITEPAALTTVLSPATTPTICPNQTATFSVAASGGPTAPYTFAINAIPGLTAATNTASPNYAITVTPNAGYTGTATYVVTVTSGSCTTLQNIVLTVAPGPTFTITNSPSYICSGTQTNITLNPAAGVNYSWAASGGSGSSSGGPATSFTQQTLTVVTGTATVTYTITPSIGGCVGTPSSTVVVVQASPTLTTTFTGASCNGTATGSATATAGGGSLNYTYTWSAGTFACSGIAGACSSTGLAANSYTVTVSDAAGCSNTSSVTVTEPLALTSTVNPATTPTICPNQTTSLTVTASGGPTSPYTFAVNTISGLNATTNAASPNFTIAVTPDPTFSGTATYVVTITSGSCTTTQNVLLTVTPAPTFTITNSPSYLCSGANTAITLNSTSGTVSYTWTATGGAGSTAGGPTTSFTQQTLTNGTGTIAVTYTITPTLGCVGTPSSTIVVVQASPTLTTSFTAPDCFGASSGTATATAAGGSLPYTYTWSGGSSTSPVSCASIPGGCTSNGLSAASYTVTVSDAAACGTTATVTLTQPTKLKATFTSGLINCFGDASTTLTAQGVDGSPGYTYEWSTGDLTASISSQPAGTYYVTVSDIKNCKKDTSIILSQPTQLTISIAATADVSCYGGNDGSISVNASGGTQGVTPAPSYTFAIDGGPYGASPQFNNLTGTKTYTLTVKDANNCTATTTVVITQPDPVTLKTTPSPENCGKVDGSVKVEVISSPVGGTPPFTAVWSNTTSGSLAGIPPTHTISSLTAGTYSVVVTDTRGCSYTTAIANVGSTGAPVITASVVQHVSIQGQATGVARVDVTSSVGASPSFLWSSTPPQTAQQATGLPAGTYTVTVTDDVTYCNSTAVVVITEPQKLRADSSFTPIICNGAASATVTAIISGGTPFSSPPTFQIRWSTGVADNDKTVIGPLGPGHYQATVTDKNGDSDITFVDITEPPVLSTNQSLATKSPNCYKYTDGVAAIDASGGVSPYTYQWTKKPSATVVSTSSFVNNAAAGTYVVNVTDANGCKKTDEVILTEPAGMTFAVSVTSDYCEAHDGTITVVVSGAQGALNFTWSAPAPNPTPVGATPTGVWATSSGIPYTLTVTDASGCSRDTVPGIFVGKGGSPTFGNGPVTTDVSIAGGSDGTATIHVVPGSSLAPYKYEWGVNGSTVSTTPDSMITGLKTGHYIVTVTSLINPDCSDTVSFWIHEPPPFSVNIAINAGILCSGGSSGSLTANDVGGVPPVISYSWTKNGAAIIGGKTLSLLTTGTYCVTIADTKGATAASCVTLTEPPVISIDTTNKKNLDCFAVATGSITLSVSGGTGSYSYAWSNSGLNSNSQNNLAAGTYRVTVTDVNGCKATKSLILSQPTAIINTIDTIAANCGRPDGSAFVKTVSGGTPQPGANPYTYLWSNLPTPSTSATLTPVAQGTYFVTITDGNNCKATNKAIIRNTAGVAATMQLPPVHVKKNGDATGSATVQGSGPGAPYRYQWTSNVNDTLATASGLVAGTYTVTVYDSRKYCQSIATVVITEPQPLTASVSATNVLCAGGNNGAIKVRAFGGISSYTISWSTNKIETNVDSSTITGLTSGTYSVTITDAGLVASTRMIINIAAPGALKVDTIIVKNVSCYGGSDGALTVTASGGTGAIRYKWSTGINDTLPVINGLPVNTYFITLTDGNGCSLVRSQAISQPDSMRLATSTVQLDCYNSTNGELTVHALGATPGYTYYWSNTKTDSTITGLIKGIYAVTVTDKNGCSKITTDSILQPDSMLIALAVTNPISCFGVSDGALKATVSKGAGGYTYQWSAATVIIGGTLDAISAIPANTYTITVKDAQNCSQKALIILSQPPPMGQLFSAKYSTVCVGQLNLLSTNPKGGTAPYRIVWQRYGPNAPFRTKGSAQDSTITDTTSVRHSNYIAEDTYISVVTDTNGCVHKDTVRVIMNKPLSVSVIGSDKVCDSYTVTLTAIPAGGDGTYTYQWGILNGSSLPGGTVNPVVVTPTNTTTYVVSLYDGCASPAATAQKVIRWYPVPRADLLPASPDAGCAPLTTVLKARFASASSAYTWNFGDGSPELTTYGEDTSIVHKYYYDFDSHGTYNVNLIVVDSLNNGCRDTSLVTKAVQVYEVPEADFEFDPPVLTNLHPSTEFIDHSVRLDTSNIVKWHWSASDGFVSDLYRPEHTFTAGVGSYTVTLTITNTQSCKDTIRRVITVSEDFAVYIPNTFTPNGDGLNDEFKIAGIGIIRMDMMIFNRWGQLVFRTNDMSKGWNGSTLDEKEIQQVDTYVYKIIVHDYKRRMHEYFGKVNLVK